MCAPKRISNYMKQKLIELEAEIDKSTIIAGEFNTLSNSENKKTEKE